MVAAAAAVVVIPTECASLVPPAGRLVVWVATRFPSIKNNTFHLRSSISIRSILIVFTVAVVVVVVSTHPPRVTVSHTVLAARFLKNISFVELLVSVVIATPFARFENHAIDLAFAVFIITLDSMTGFRVRSVTVTPYDPINAPFQAVVPVVNLKIPDIPPILVGAIDHTPTTSNDNPVQIL